MAASEHPEAEIAGIDRKGKAALRDPIGGIESGLEAEFVAIPHEAAEEGTVAAVVDAKAAGEAWVGGDGAQAFADGGRAGEGRLLRGEAEEDLGGQVAVFQNRRRRRQHLACSELTGRNVELKQPPRCGVELCK
jgi:hypothetical protein